MVYRSFEELEVWKRSCSVAIGVYDIAKRTNDVGLKEQMQRAAVSIASNIAEGCERGGRDFSRFLRIALGSTAELRTQLYIARKLGDFDDEKLRSLISETKEISKMLTGLRKSLVDPKINPPQKNAPLQLKTEN